LEVWKGILLLVFIFRNLFFSFKQRILGFVFLSLNFVFFSMENNHCTIHIIFLPDAPTPMKQKDYKQFNKSMCFL